MDFSVRSTVDGTIIIELHKQSFRYKLTNCLRRRSSSRKTDFRLEELADELDLMEAIDDRSSKTST